MSEQLSFDGAHTTPLMAQYHEIKKKCLDSLLFFRLGDFYELFFDDAVIASQILDIALTKRGKHEGSEIPMCGVPVHAHESYLSKLIKAGQKVAICEQLEDPQEAKKRGYKAIVKRDVVRFITPGTIVEEDLLQAREHNYLLSFVAQKTRVGLAWVDISSGNLSCLQIPFEQAENHILRLDPKEMLVSEKQLHNIELFEFFKEFKPILSPQPQRRFEAAYAEERFLNFYGTKATEAFGQFSTLELMALGALIDYLDLTQKGNIPRLSIPRQVKPDQYMDIDPATRLNLELLKSLSGPKKGSLLDCLDETMTSQGARLLAHFISNPLQKASAIQARLDVVSYFFESQEKLNCLRQFFQPISDFERSLSRLLLERYKPRDLNALKIALIQVTQIRDHLNGFEKPDLLSKLTQNLGNHDALLGTLESALAFELPLTLKEGGIIRSGYHPGLDELRSLRDESARLIANLQAGYVRKTGISSLKIKHNNILGYFVEVTALQADKIGEGFFHRQTLANNVRFSTPELTELETKIGKATEQALAIEHELLQEILNQIQEQADVIAHASQSIAMLDVLLTFAHLALTRQWTKPIVDESTNLEIQKGRHPIVERALLAQKGDPFVPNDCVLNQHENLWLLTGPNMAGKSTFLRQNALIVILAQIGSFVPAESALIGVVDKLASRIGASDDLAKGRSTFMVEMVETAAILNQATPRSLVILDEIGRGTATFDGLSIAWACLEYLHNVNGSRTLFATHYHELTQLSGILPRLGCYRVNVKDWEGKIIFLHEVIKGQADRSYGIHVAELAGIPKEVISRAQVILADLEQKNHHKDISRLEAVQMRTPLEAELRQIDLEALTPLKAFDLIVKWIERKAA